MVGRGRAGTWWRAIPLVALAGAVVAAPASLPGEPAVAGEGDLPRFTAWRYIVLHHSGTVGGNARRFDRLHRARGWDGLGYHFVITNGSGGPDGAIEVGERWWEQKHGAHAGALTVRALPEERNLYNELGIGICLVGNFQRRPPTSRQIHTLARLLRRLQTEFRIPSERIVGHRHVRRTACPGRYFPWRQIVRLTGMTFASRLGRRQPQPTLDRCVWCLRQERLLLEPLPGAGSAGAVTDPPPHRRDALPPR